MGERSKGGRSIIERLEDLLAEVEILESLEEMFFKMAADKFMEITKGKKGNIFYDRWSARGLGPAFFNVMHSINSSSRSIALGNLTKKIISVKVLDYKAEIEEIFGPMGFKVVVV